MDWSRHGCGWDGSIYLEVRYGIGFSDFGQSSWIFYLLVKGIMLRFISLLGYVFPAIIGSVVVLVKGGRLCEMISQFYFGCKEVQSGLIGEIE